MTSQQLGSKWPLFFRFRYNAEAETPADTRNLLLIVVTLIAAVTFQAGVNPPGGVWQEDGHGRHKAGRAIYPEQRAAFTVFLSANTLAFSLAIQIIISLTYKFPFYAELWTATISMFLTYVSAIFAVAPDESINFRYVLSAGALPFVFQLFKKLYRTYRWSENHSADQNATKPVELKLEGRILENWKAFPSSLNVNSTHLLDDDFAADEKVSSSYVKHDRQSALK